jgi:CheY-like chemotaxis protein
MFLTDKNSPSSPLNSFREVKPTPRSKKIRFSSGALDSQPLVLIVEDDPDTRLMLKYLLEMWNHRVIEAMSGEEAVEMAAKTNPDVILMDLKLPKIDGLTATERICALPTPVKPVIIFVSAVNDGQIRDSALSVGADEYLIKPINFGELERMLEKHLKINKVNQTQTLSENV